MNNETQIYYLEIVSNEPESACAGYTKTLGITFSEPVAELGGACIAKLAHGGMLGVRSPMHGAEEPVTRPYYLVSNIEIATEEAKENGADIMVPPMVIPGYGKCAILMFGALQSGLWEV